MPAARALLTCAILVIGVAAISLRRAGDPLHPAPETDAEGFDLLTDQLVMEQTHEQNHDHPLVMEQTHRAEDESFNFGPELPNKLMIWGHHKAGSKLGIRLSNVAGDILGMWHEHYGDGSATQGCMGARFIVHQNFEMNAMNNIIRGCPNFRAVHIIRDPFTLTASAYIYHKKYDDVPFNPWFTEKSHTGPWILQNKPLEEGLQIESRAEVGFTLPSMRDVHVRAQNMTDKVLTVHLEDFHDDFEKTTRRLFSFLLGSNHSKLDQIVNDATAKLGMMQGEKDVDTLGRKGANHEVEEEVKAVLDGLRKSGNEDIKKMFDFREPLGYTTWR